MAKKKKSKPCSGRALQSEGSLSHKDFNKSKNFVASKDTIKKVKKQLTELGKTFTKHTSDKGFAPKALKNYYNSIMKRQTSYIQEKRSEQTFPQRR